MGGAEAIHLLGGDPFHEPMDHGFSRLPYTEALHTGVDNVMTDDS